MRTLSSLAAATGLACLAMASSPGIVLAGDWPNWRGPNHDNTSAETNLPDSWDPRGGEGSNLLWKSKALAGRSTPIVMRGKLYTLVRNRPGTELEGEKIVCADAATGEVLWEHHFNVYLSDVPDTRVGWSSVTGDPETGYIYTQGVCGYFCCLEGATGQVVWERSLHEELGLLSTYGGRTNFPLIFRDTVITSAVVIGWGDTPKWGLLAKPAHRFLGLDKQTGQLRWLSGTRLIPYDTTYSTPALKHLNGQDLLVFGSGDGAVWGMQAATGKTVWQHRFSRRGLNVSPVVSPQGRVFTGHSEENIVGNTMGGFVAIDGAGAGDLTDKPLWQEYQVMAGKSSPLFIDGKVYVTTDSAKMVVFDAETGDQLSRKALGRVSRGTPLYADGKIYYGSRGGMFSILKPNADGSLDFVQNKKRLRGEAIDASPIAANGRVYITTSEYVYCIANPDANSAAAAGPPLPPRPQNPEMGAAQLQIAPYDSLLTPGDSKSFRVTLFTETGDFHSVASGDEVTFTVDGPGQISRTGLYEAPSDALHECALVTAKVGELTGTARVRIVPPLPWNFDFEGVADVPLTWVGGRIRYNLREEDSGNHYIAKPTELPTRPGKPTTKLGTRSRMWMGPSDLANYTIQADVQMKTGVAGEWPKGEPLPEFPGSAGDSAIKLPSVGLINSRYTFALNGPNKRAELYSWCTHDKRTQSKATMDFEAGKWYTMKLKVVPDKANSRAEVMAKIWPRDESEPDTWTLKFFDAAPNYYGSPGLFGDAKEAEFYLDNLKVTPN